MAPPVYAVQRIMRGRTAEGLHGAGLPRTECAGARERHRDRPCGARRCEDWPCERARLRRAVAAAGVQPTLVEETLPPADSDDDSRPRRTTLWWANAALQRLCSAEGADVSLEAFLAPREAALLRGRATLAGGESPGVTNERLLRKFLDATIGASTARLPDEVAAAPAGTCVNVAFADPDGGDDGSAPINVPFFKVPRGGGGVEVDVEPAQRADSGITLWHRGTGWGGAVSLCTGIPLRLAPRLVTLGKHFICTEVTPLLASMPGAAQAQSWPSACMPTAVTLTRDPARTWATPQQTRGARCEPLAA